MKAWEENDEDDKNDWDFIVNYFSIKMVAINKYLQNNGDETKYESAANVTQEEELADVGEELQKYILTLTQANEQQKQESAAIVKDTKIDEMAEQMMKLETMMATLLTTLTAAPGKPKDGSKPKDDDNKNKFKWRYNRNMGGYCHSCGYHPIGRKHTSLTCGKKAEGHDDDATWTNHGTKGSKSWPSEKKVTDKDKEHESYKNKERPAN
jgi:rubrerythrin